MALPPKRSGFSDNCFEVKGAKMVSAESVFLSGWKIMKVRDLMRLLESEGWQHMRAAGSHRVFKPPANAKLVTVAGKPGDDVPNGTLKTILKDFGLEAK